MAETPRVLLIAEAANPEWVSVPLLGWSQGVAIAGRVAAHLVTQIRNREAIVRAGLVEGRDFTAIDSEAVAAPIYQLIERLRGGAGKGWTTVTAFSTISYYYFEHIVWKKFEADLRRGKYNIVHRLTPLSPTTPSLIASKCRKLGVPFVLGPLNGGVAWPRQFDHIRREEKEWLSYVRGAYKLLPGYRSTLRDAAAIIAGSRDTMKQIPRQHMGKSIYMPENGIDPARFVARRTRKASRPVRVVFVGRLVPYKGADMVIEAAGPLVREGAMKVDIIGDGPQMGQLKRMVEEMRLEEGVRLRGWVEHARVQEELAQNDVFAFPSIREFGGAVALEAMAVGVVPVVVNYGGPAELVTPETGYLAPLGDRGQIVASLREILARLAADPAEIDRKSAAGMRRAREMFTWDTKARQIEEIYRWVLGSTQGAPCFGEYTGSSPEMRTAGGRGDGDE